MGWPYINIWLAKMPPGFSVLLYLVIDYLYGILKMLIWMLSDLFFETFFFRYQTLDSYCRILYLFLMSSIFFMWYISYISFNFCWKMVCFSIVGIYPALIVASSWLLNTRSCITCKSLFYGFILFKFADSSPNISNSVFYCWLHQHRI
ncbi:MAG: hypothetical protein Ta2E_00740 [Mycoplasmoidaceae bacterium]|nr:MAG: hypothetical protein Ta2E_00740 [Mycoplasmoidaceae bacterium]